MDRSSHLILQGFPLTPEGAAAQPLDDLRGELPDAPIDQVFERAAQLAARFAAARGRVPLQGVEAVVRFEVGDGEVAYYRISLAPRDGGWLLSAHPTGVEEPLIDVGLANEVVGGALREVLGPEGPRIWQDYLERRGGARPLRREEILEAIEELATQNPDLGYRLFDRVKELAIQALLEIEKGA